MNTSHRPLLALLAGTLLATPALALAQSHDHPHDPAEAVALGMALEQDPHAPVYIVTSRDTHVHSLKDQATNADIMRDSLGNALVVSQVSAHQLPAISERIHAREKRCGGYFAFATRAEAVAFVADGEALRATQQAFLVDYGIDNQATVDPWLGQVQETRIRGTISHLSTQYDNRYYSSTHGRNAALWIRDTWQALGNGRSDVSAELFESCGNCATQPSVILTVQGNELADEIVVVGGHLDSISNSGSGNAMNAPGADDDASGIASVTEVIRVALASGWKPKRTVKFMAYAAEEVGLRGSNAIAQQFKAQGQDVVGVLQMDMTNYAAGSSVAMNLVADYSNASLKQFLNALFDEYLAPMGLSRGTYTCGYGCSDHASWTNAGFPAAMMFEPTFNNRLHTPNDTLQGMGGTANASVNFSKLGLAFIGELGKTSGSGPDPDPDPDPTPGGELEKGVPKTGLSANSGSSLNYTLVVPAGASNLSFTTSGGSGDADLYVKFGTAPTDSSYDCRPYKSGNAETCTFASPQAGTWHVRIKAYSSFSGVSLVGNYQGGGNPDPDPGEPCTGCDTYSGSLSGTGSSAVQPNGTYYPSAAGAQKGWLRGPSGTDFDLELYRWSGSGWSKVASSTTPTSEESVSYNGSAGYYYWKVLSYSGSGNYQLWLDTP
ncbi:M20/M25/M40 family metallo-hydrolase [Lysobacter sp. SG-8]|uniref:M20/M25/M40 family metallo-hydrolase n=1 Tax=Marilutibacter penaei TaxID=2759900 RepID=A0A7W3U3T7_9GAMM|nr:M20/M25/M40 family metallo-hydrolase [Lysobacter penaei]MBB1088433.1 M20/M25/M40 family metallo-hydrolase [Lysobacter penaei]